MSRLSTKKASIIAPRLSISVTEARKILGTTATGLSDETIEHLVAQVDVLTDIIVAHVSDSKIESSIDISNGKSHTGG